MIENGDQFDIGDIMFQVELHTGDKTLGPIEHGLSVWGKEEKSPVKNWKEMKKRGMDIEEENGKHFTLSHPLICTIPFNFIEDLEVAVSALQILQEIVSIDSDIQSVSK